jgi:monofunctional biosynthetic peptidoglycan transglycosylase
VILAIGEAGMHPFEYVKSEGGAMFLHSRTNYHAAHKWVRVATHLMLVLALFIGETATGSEEKEKVFFAFDTPKEMRQWQNVDDPVMGGLSRSSMGATNNGTAVFSGIVSLENFGGFASVRSKNADHDLGTYDGVAARLKGDGKTYEIMLKDETPFGGFSYYYKFKTTKGDWITVKGPFRDFVPRFHGRVLDDRPPIEGQNVRSVGFLIADKQEGPFSLEIDWIKAYRKD